MELYLRRHNIKTLIQCDFDGTITFDDISYGILEDFAEGDWHRWVDKYHRGEINVAEFNKQTFSMVKSDKQTLIEYARRHARLRPGFRELLDFCHKHNLEFVIVSNGFDFYIDTVLSDLGLSHIQTVYGKTEFNHTGLGIKYFSPAGIEMTSGFKEAYTILYKEQGYRIIYIGNGLSDIPSARLSYRIFARDDLLSHCNEAKLPCVPFEDMHDVVKGLADING